MFLSMTTLPTITTGFRINLCLRNFCSSSGVIVHVRLNGQAETIRIWVEKKDKSLSFSPF